MSYAWTNISFMTITGYRVNEGIHQLKNLVVLLLLITFVTACSRQFAISVNEQSIYDPRVSANSLAVNDADLQGCLNLALRQ